MKVEFKKKIEKVGLLKREINAFKVCVSCGCCGEKDSIVAEVCNPKDYGWIYMHKFNNNKIDDSGCWFCSAKCQKKQTKKWTKKASGVD